MPRKKYSRLASFAASVTAIAVLAGCSQASTEKPAASGETREITSEMGKVEVPVDAKRIVALDEPAALNLLSIGITPVAVYDSWSTTVPKQILEDEGIEIHSTSTWYPELEEVAELDPDLIVGSAAEGFAQSAPDYSSVAPLVAGLYAGTGQEIIEAYGEYFDRAEQAEAVAKVLDEMGEANAQAQDAEPKSLSVLMSWAQDNMPLYMDNTNSLHGALASSGFTRPELQDAVPEEGSAFGGWTPFSPEQLPEHDADVLAVAVAAQYNLDGITDLPLYEKLGAVTNDHSVVVDGDLWSGGAAFYTYWVLADLATFADDSFAPGTEKDAADRWAAFIEAAKA